MNATADIRAWYASAFARFEEGLNGASKTPLHALRRKGLAAFAGQGFPTTADEEWRFTSLAPIATTQFQPVLASTGGSGPADLPAGPWPGPGAGGIVLVFVNGHFSSRLSSTRTLPRGVSAGSLAGAMAKDPSLAGLLRQPGDRGAHEAFTALNTAFLVDGAFVRVDDGVTLDAPVHVLSIASAGATPLLVQPRHLIIAGAGARVSVVETYGGEGVYLTNAVTEVIVGEGGTVEHDRLQMESRTSYHVGTTYISVGAKAAFTSNAVNFGGAIVRNNVNALFNGEYAECTLNGLSVAGGTQVVDNHTVIDHATPRCQSHELYKSVLDGKARGVFNGKIFVRQDAQKTDAKQTNKTLLLSDDATIDTKPQLEIFADDVKCTHGATVGQLDEEQVFYLRARGIGEAEARDLLTFAFATDVINRVHVDALRETLDGLLHTRLRQGRVTMEQ